MNMELRWHDRYTSCTVDGRKVLVFNRTRPGLCEDELSRLPDDIARALNAGELELWEEMSHQSNKIILRTTAKNQHETLPLMQ